MRAALSGSPHHIKSLHKQPLTAAVCVCISAPEFKLYFPAYNLCPNSGHHHNYQLLIIYIGTGYLHGAIYSKALFV